MNTQEISKIILNAIGKPALSNCYLSYNEIICKIESKEFQVLSSNDIVLLIQENNSVNKMYYFVNEDNVDNINEDVYNYLQNKIKNHPRLVTDYITKVPCQEFDIIESMGYRPYKKYLRYHMLAENAGLFEQNDVAVFAEESDIEMIYGILHCSLDILTDHVPSKKELQAFIIKQQIIKICRENEIAGVLLHEKQGVKSYLRALCVQREYEKKGIGYSLMQNYIKSVINTTKQFYLWVESTNKGAINLYQKFDYEPDGLIDYIFLYEEMGL